MKTTIKNRKDQNVVVLLEEATEPIGLAFIMHGLGGFKEQVHLQAMAEVFLARHYTVVRFDTTNTFGESDGDYADATTTNYYEDLEDVVAWSKGQAWYHEPFVLVGHSLGALSVALYAEKYPELVKALAPISTVVSGALSLEQKNTTGELEEWKRTGWRITMSSSKPGVEKRLKWSHMEDRLQYDLIPHAAKLIMPVLLIVGDLDDSTPPAQQQVFYDSLPGKKELHIITGAPHTFKDPKHLVEIREIVGKWIDSI